MVGSDDRGEWRDEWSLGESFVPKSRYVSPAFARLEAQRLWTRVWQVACREDDLSEPGSFVEYSVVDQSVIVVRQENGEIKAFQNACRHRGRQLGIGCGRFEGKQIRCPYHGWSWDLAGENTYARTKADLDPERSSPAALRLVECLVGTWAGFVFVNLDRNAPPLLDYLAPIRRLVDPFRIERQKPLYHKRTILPANWKAAFDAFTESYHVVTIHPESGMSPIGTREGIEYFRLENGHSCYRFLLTDQGGRPGSEEIDPRREIYEGISFKVDSVGAMAVERDRHVAAQLLNREIPEGSTAGEEFNRLLYEHAAGAGIDLPVLDRESASFIGGVFYMFPNFMMLPGIGSTLIYRARPNRGDPDSCVWEFWSTTVFPDDEDPPRCEVQDVDHRDVDACGLVLSQDFANMEPMQRGMKALGFDGLNLSRREEMAIHHMHAAIDEYVRS